MLSIPSWLFVLGGFVSISGFLIAYNFYSNFLLYSLDPDFLKARYLSVGLTFLLLQLIIALPFLYSQFKGSIGLANTPGGSARDSVASGESPLYLDAPLMASSLLMVVNLYMVAVFIPARSVAFLSEAWIAIMFVFSITIFGNLAIVPFSKIIEDPYRSRFVHYAHWVVLGLLIIADGYEFNTLFPTLIEMLYRNGWTFIVLTSMEYVVLARVLRRDREFSATINGATEISAGKARRTRSHSRFYLWCTTIATLTPFYYLAVLSFAFTVYPYIPVSRGGGDYDASPEVALYFSDDAGTQIPPDLLDHSQQTDHVKSLPVIIIFVGDNSIYVAQKRDKNGPKDWRRRDNWPHVYEVNKRAIVAIQEITL